MSGPEMEFEPEATKLTAIAFEEAGRLVGRDDVQAALLRAYALDGTPFYLHVMGQSSAGGHGKQGLHPDRVDRLRHLDGVDAPVLMAFCEGRGKWHWEWLRVLDAQGPANAVDRAVGHKRFGWAKRRFFGGGVNRPLVLPPSGPPTVESGRLVA